MSSGVTLKELNRLFDFLKQSKVNDEMTVLITNDMCKSLYDLMENCVKYQDKLQSNWNSLRECIDYQLKHNVGSSVESSIRNHVYQEIKDKINKLKGEDKYE